MPRLDPDLNQRVRHLHFKECMSIENIANFLGISMYRASLHKMTEEEADAYLKKRTQQVMAWQKKNGRNYQRKETYQPKPLEDLPPIPPDTRSVTGRLMGDPLPGRSYLDKVRAEKQSQQSG